jgi:phenol hydroxylase P0 protein
VPDPDRPITPELLVADTSRRFVTVLEQRADGLVLFEFAIGWPELSVELMLPAAAFDEFCAANRVQRLDRAPAAPEPEENDE